MTRTPVVTRFAPSPTGPLHLGHAYSAILAHDLAERHGGTFLLRIEDIDQGRSRRHWEDAIRDDLSWLGLRWPEPVMRQSERLGRHHAALARLRTSGLTYACTCTRRDIQAAASAPQEGAPLHGPDGVVYPGTCRDAGLPHDGAPVRLDMARALRIVAPISFKETGIPGPGTVDTSTEEILRGIGDVVLARRDMGTSYHLGVVIDDADQGVTHVARGRDLFEATPIHVVLQKLLGLATPVYHHHDLIRDDTGKRLAKRDDARAIATYRAAGTTPEEIRAMVGLRPRGA